MINVPVKNMARARWIPAALLLAMPSCLEARSNRYFFDIPPETLATSMVAVGDQAGVTIGVSDPTIEPILLRGVHGNLTVPEALDRLLAGSPATYYEVDLYSYRILAKPKTRPKRPRPPEIAPSPVVETTDITVVASKRNLPLSFYPGSVTIVDANAFSTAQKSRGSEALVATQPILASTHLGPGRDKLFVRGIADSSFNGPTQSTVGQYLGEARLNFNAPDPDLSLYDLHGVEILEGPQGTLYGAGALGGVIRLSPNMPDLNNFALDGSAGLSATQHGGIGYDVAAMVNVPVLKGLWALRSVAYRTVEAGYIDNPQHKRSDINRTTTQGGRTAVRMQPAPDWTLDITGVVQDIDSRDGQYTRRGLSRYTRSNQFAEPFDNNYALGNVTLQHAVGGVVLTSSTSIVRHDLSSDYDATISETPRLYRELNRITVVTNETRLAQSGPGGNGWVAGFELLYSADHIIRQLGSPDDLLRISGTRNETLQGALYGEATAQLMPRLLATAGGRISFDDLSGVVLDRPDGDIERHRTEGRFLPSAGLLWRPFQTLKIFARYQMGYRAGGLSVVGNEAQRFKSDELATIEGGVRIGSEAKRFSGSFSVSKAIWKHIQSDLIGADGLPTTTNIGNGRVYGLEATVSWRLVAGLEVQGAIFLNESSLFSPAPGFTGTKDASLPNIADCGIYGKLQYALTLPHGDHLTLRADARYTGRSKLGVGPTFALPQGKYVNMSAGAALSMGRVTLTADLTNLLNAGANIFAFGNPFGFSSGQQITPLRPRSVRFGVELGF